MKLVKEISDAKAIGQLVLADKTGREHGDRLGKYLIETGRKPGAEALLTAIRTNGVQRFERTHAA